MKKIFKIARLELNILFYSPIAWLLVIIFGVQAGLTFTEILYAQETSQQLERPLQVLSKVLFAGDNGLFKAVQDTLYLYIPLLTMGLLSRETSSGSIKLLLSSPVKISEIVFGKFLSIVIYSFLLIVVLSLYVIAAHFSIEALDVPFVLGGLLGLFLLACAYAAIGLFMSSLTSYQVVAAISTLAVLAGLNFIGQIGQDYDLVRDITYWVSISGRADNIVNGLVTSRDIIYFILVIGLFLSLTIMKLNGGRQTLSLATKTMRYSLLIGLVLIVGYVTSLPALTGYYDTTRFKDRTVTPSPQTQKLIEQIKTPLTITSYVNVVHYTAPYGAPKNRIKDMEQFQRYQRFLPDMKMNYVMYYDTTMYNFDTTKTLIEKAKKASEAHGFTFKKLLTPEQIKEKINLIPEENRFVRIVEIDGKKTALRMYDDMVAYPKEAEISAAIKRLLYKPALAGFLKGNEERNTNKIGDKDYKGITKGLSTRGSLINQGFDVIDLALDSLQEIPLDLAVLIIADPKDEYNEAQTRKIENYIAAGGNIVFAGEPGRQSLLNPMLKKLGISLIPGTLLEESENFELDLIQASFTKEAADYGFTFYDKAIVTFPGASGIQYKDSGDFKITPLLFTNKAVSWNKLGEFDLKIDKVTFNPQTETKQSVPVAVALSRNVSGKEQKIMVFGDADFLSNAELGRYTPHTVNGLFSMRMFKWFSNGEYPVDVSRPESIDTKILVSRKQINWQKGLFLGFLPFAIGLFGSVTLIRRKRN
jgi:ABC-2 type transport system permease protein